MIDASTGYPDAILAHLVRKSIAPANYVAMLLDHAEATKPLQDYLAAFAAPVRIGTSSPEFVGTSKDKSFTKYASLGDLAVFTKANWDGCGAQAVTFANLNRTAQLLDALPSKYQSSVEVAPGADGSVCMEWYSEDKKRRVFIDVGPEDIIKTYTNSPEPLEIHFTKLDEAKSHSAQILQSAGI